MEKGLLLCVDLFYFYFFMDVKEVVHEMMVVWSQEESQRKAMYQFKILIGIGTCIFIKKCKAAEIL